MAPIVQTSYGALQGSEEQGVAVFRGIPFAQPPIGPLRFRPPQRPDGWSGVRDATRFGAGSFQANRPLAPLLGIVIPEQSEDCLFLNVWTPAADGARRPVLVWVHGGAWVIGAGSEVTYDGAALARRGAVVVVTLNYRLGAFGFLRGKDLPGGRLDSSGNEGLLDVIAALQWVRDEIAAFGGDPANVTLMGESAGSVNTACLLTAAPAKGLFHKAVLESGSLNLTTTPERASATARLLLDELGIPPEQAGRLREVPAPELLGAQNAIAGRSAATSFAPVADGELIPARPFEAIAAGSARGLPLLIGTNREEMKLYRFLDPAIEALDEAGLLRRCEPLFPGTAANGTPNAARAIAVYREARAARGEETAPAELWLAISTDQVFRAGALKLATLHAAHTPQTYVYRFDWPASAADGPRGATHALELPFVFGTLDRSEIGRLAGRTPAAYALSERMQDAWLAFARTGSPRSESLPDWPPYAPPRRATMLLAEQPRVVDAPQEPERAFWEAFI